MKRKTIRNHKDFLTTADDFKASTDGFILKAKPTKIPDDARYGIIVSKRTLKLAVQRNRAKRLIRDWIAFNERYMLPELDYIFILYRNILEIDRKNGRKKVAHTIKKISKMYKNAKESQ